MSGSRSGFVSPLGAWLHPSRTARELAEAQASLRDNAERLSALGSSLEALRRDMATRDAEVTSLALRLTNSQTRIVCLQEDLRQAYIKMEDNEEVTRRMDELDRRLAGFEKVKREYEKTIAELRSRLADARSTIRTLTGEDIDNELTDIDMLPLPPRRGHSPLHRVHGSYTQSRDDARSDHNNPGPGRNDSETRPEFDFPKSGQSPDWLIPLPDSL